MDVYLVKILTGAVGLIVGFGGYWAMTVDKRLTTLETKQADDKLQSATKLAKLETLLEKMAEQIDRIYNELQHERGKK